jgi:hypothetical protein
MKKILVAFVIGCMAMVMTSCSDNSPKGVAIQAVKCMQQKDFKGYVDLLNLPDATDEQKTTYVAMLQEKASKKPEAFDIKNFEVVDEQVDEEAGTARITIKMVDGEGKEQNNPIDLVKNDKGEWKIKNKK